MFHAGGEFHANAYAFALNGEVIVKLRGIISVKETATAVTRCIYYTKLPTLKALRESEDTIASVLGDFFDTFFLHLKKKKYYEKLLLSIILLF